MFISWLGNFFFFSSDFIKFNLHAKHLPFKVYDLVVISILAEVYSHHHHLFPELAHHPKRDSLHLCNSHFPPPPSPWQPQIHVLFLGSCLLWACHRDGLTHCGPVCLASLPEHRVLRVLPCCSA